MDGKCSCHKGVFRSRRIAERTMRKVGGERVYFCKEAGGYHITRYTRSELDQLWAGRLGATDRA